MRHISRYAEQHFAPLVLHWATVVRHMLQSNEFYIHRDWLVPNGRLDHAKTAHCAGIRDHPGTSTTRSVLCVMSPPVHPPPDSCPTTHATHPGGF